MKRTNEEWLAELAARGFRIGLSVPYGGRRSYAEIRPSALTIRLSEQPGQTPMPSNNLHGADPRLL